MKIAFFTETFLPKVDGIVTRLTKTIQHLVAAGGDHVAHPVHGGAVRQGDQDVVTGQVRHDWRAVGLAGVPTGVFDDRRVPETPAC